MNSTTPPIEPPHNPISTPQITPSEVIPPSKKPTNRLMLLVALVVLMIVGAVSILFLGLNSSLPTKRSSIIQQPKPQSEPAPVVYKDLTYKGNLSFVNVSDERSVNYLTHKFNLTQDNNTSDTALCSSTPQETRVRMEVGSVKDMTLYECTATSQLHCYEDKAETKIIACPGAAILKKVYYSLERSKQEVYQTAIALDNAVPDSYKQSNINKQWILTSKLTASSLDATIGSRRIGETAFYRFDCSDPSTSVEQCTSYGGADQYLYYRPAWSTQYYIVQLLDVHDIGSVSGKALG